MKRKLTLLFSAMLCLSINLSAQTPVPNGNLENWTDSITCQSWTTNNYNLGGFIYYSFVHQSTDANGGTYAAKIETLNIPVVGNMGGLMTLGSYDLLTGISGGIPISGKPDTLKGYLKYAPVSVDTAVIAVIMTKWNGSSQDVLFNQGIAIFSTVSSYTLFNIPITYTPPTESPDTVNIIIYSSYLAPQEGSTLYVDDLSFVYNNPGVQEYADANSISVFPNPTGGLLNIMLDGNNNTVIVYNIIGEEIMNQQTSLKNLNVDLSEFPAGVYMLEVSSCTAKYYKKVIISR